MQLFNELFGNVLNFTWQQGVMIVIGCALIWCAIKREMEPALLLPMGFGAILVNLPFVNTEAIETMFNAGIATELFPAAAVHRHRRHDRLWAFTFQPKDDALWRGGSVWYILYSWNGGAAGL